MKFRLGIGIIGIFFLVGCKAVSIEKAFRAIHVAGLPNLNNYNKYVIELKANQPFTINDITLIAGDSIVKIDSYAFLNLKTRLGHTVSTKSKDFDSGLYELSITQTPTIQDLTNEIIIICYESKSSTHLLKIPIQQIVRRNDK